MKTRPPLPHLRGSMARLRKFVLASSLTSILVSASISAIAHANGVVSSDFSFSSRGIKLSALLKDIGSNFGMPAVISPEINDTFIGTIEGRTAQQILERLSRLYKLSWYYGGNILYVYKAEEMRADVFNPAHLSAEEIISYIQSAGLTNGGACSARAVQAFNAVEFSGVPICMERMLKLSKEVDQRQLQQSQTKEIVRVFPLKYASAIDVSYAYRDQQVKIPGVVSELREMIKSRGIAAPTNGGQVAPAAGTETTFSADTRNNAVIVRDRQSNMDIYAELIRQLDQKPQQIEVSVAIIDVDSGDLHELGVDYSGQVSFGGAKVGFNRSATEDNGGTFSALLNNSAEFFVKVTALERNSKAKILSRPSIVTLNNVQAVLDRSTTFYTKLEGERVADLASVSTGSLLRVTPRIVDGESHKEVLLTLDIQDGRQEGVTNNIERLPQVKNSGIATQAILKPGQSLLLGGFVEEKHREGTTKIPLLGDLPLIGSLFRSHAKESASMVRLFVIRAEPHAT
ncbi:EscC/YscC/HrcC family type III secretion system outer membrane ring protein [Cupriavidus pampae]|uniref:Type 3 secretion system secretin n=1 Tax=Cupriavidus pampae TaxID=659251 RepID=A0ABN7ZIZ9_9BURK|nr:EscC/YscC/HrcC family type III secretion system outer membrane ring protein [Cupriavidus pampae]CAG9185949.1 Type 3 secretion system secretin [Cupriavidus pampae]